VSDERERGLVCVFCGAGFGYAGEQPTEYILKASVDHEKECPNNPYLAEIAALKSALKERNVKIRAVCLRLMGEHGQCTCKHCETARELLAGMEGE